MHLSIFGYEVCVDDVDHLSSGDRLENYTLVFTEDDTRAYIGYVTNHYLECDDWNAVKISLSSVLGEFNIQHKSFGLYHVKSLENIYV